MTELIKQNTPAAAVQNDCGLSVAAIESLSTRCRALDILAQRLDEEFEAVLWNGNGCE